jgi:hypothetical protein
MALIPLIDCYELLDIDPKTLRLSLKRAGMEVCPHPTDARIKCLTTQQLELLALMHKRPLRPSQAGEAAGPGFLVSPSPELPARREEPSSSQEDRSLSQQLSLVERRVEKLSEQVIEVARLLLKVQDHLLDQHLAARENDREGEEGQPSSLSQEPRAEIASPSRAAEFHPAEARKRTLLPLIEYSPDGLGLIVSSQKGEWRLEPDAEKWFSFLATISSFRFVGKSGRFSACRNSEHGQQTRGWIAHRYIHGHNYRHYLGVTDRLTLAHLEQTAARFQAYLIKS